MRVMVIVKATQSSEAGVMPSEELFRDMGNFNEQLVKAGIMVAGDGLKPAQLVSGDVFHEPSAVCQTTRAYDSS